MNRKSRPNLMERHDFFTLNAPHFLRVENEKDGDEIKLIPVIQNDLLTDPFIARLKGVNADLRVRFYESRLTALLKRIWMDDKNRIHAPKHVCV